jgi:hypothetical protein
LYVPASSFLFDSIENVLVVAFQVNHVGNFD